MKTRLDKTMLYAAYAYIVLPYVIFALGWLKWYFAVAISLAVIISCVLAIGQYKDLKQVSLRKHAKKIGVTLFVILVWVCLSGIGGYSFQGGDFLVRNAIFHDLISHKWPVIYENFNGVADSGGNGAPHTYILTYYMGFWLPAAVMGKIFGWATGNLFLYLWAVVGITLIFYFIARYFERFSLKILWVFIFFSSLYIYGSFARLPVKAVLLSDSFLWANHMFFAGSNTGLLFWVFNQCVTPWLIFVLILNNIPKQNIIFIYILCLFYGPFSFLGMFPFVLYFICKDLFAKDGQTGILKRFIPFFSFQNVVSVLFVFVPLYLYMSANDSVQRFVFLVPGIFKYAQVVFLSFGVLAVLLFPRYKREPMYYIALFILLILPLFRMGGGVDFCARVSIPPMLFLVILCIQVVLEEKNTMLKRTIIIYLFIGSVESVTSVGRAIAFTGYSYINPPAANLFLYNREKGYPLWQTNYITEMPDSLKGKNFLINDDLKRLDAKGTDIVFQNFLSNTEKGFFYKYLAKHD